MQVLKRIWLTGGRRCLSKVSDNLRTGQIKLVHCGARIKRGWRMADQDALFLVRADGFSVANDGACSDAVAARILDKHRLTGGRRCLSKVSDNVRTGQIKLVHCGARIKRGWRMADQDALFLVRADGFSVANDSACSDAVAARILRQFFLLYPFVLSHNLYQAKQVLTRIPKS